MTTPNPLLSATLPLPFDRIEACHVEPAVAEQKRLAQARLDAIRSPGDSLTFDSVIRALEAATEPLERTLDLVGHLESVATTPELRAAYNAVLPEVSAFFSSIPLDAELWRTVSQYADSEEGKQLTGHRARLLKKTIDGFRRHGAALSADDKAQLSELEVELAKATTKFGEHVLDATNAFELVITDEKRLAGLPASAVAYARGLAESKGIAGYRLTLQAPSVIPVLTYLDDRGIREQIWRAYNGRATSGEHNNRSLLDEVLALRRRKAKLLGHADFADFALEDRMAKHGATARRFVDDLRRRTSEAFERERLELASFAATLEHGPVIAPWDVGYLAEKQRRAQYDLDEEQLRPYFGLDRVLAGAFELAHRLYGVEIVRTTGIPTWDDAVQTYEIREAGQRLGMFYADLLPRENKRPGAWMQGLVLGRRRDDGRRDPHVGLICGNLTPPSGSRPSLLTHAEVETIFHEFGHLLHHLLTEVESRSIGGTNVAWDFVELPSQIMENWCWERQALDLFAEHFETGERLPDELYTRMNRARNFRSASAMMRQLGFADVDLALHTEYDAARDGDVVEYCRRRMQPFAPTTLPESFAMICSFSHLFSSPTGYAAGYYSYKWAEVLDADAFTAFQAAGLFDRATGERFRREILAVGDAREADESFRAFMGRDPDLQALLRRSALAS
ncbi:MAG: M3 family metallopeptidase [Myxococcales bacterium FL481]|nr:MAG: M3 family metallopeptidase [Myxococcales bacterium FL481]